MIFQNNIWGGNINYNFVGDILLVNNLCAGISLAITCPKHAIHNVKYIGHSGTTCKTLCNNGRNLCDKLGKRIQRASEH